MTSLRTLLLAGAAILFGAAPALAQSSVRLDLPAGLLQKTGAVTMAPIASSVPGLNDERRQGRIRVLSPQDHDLYLRAMAAGEHGDWIAARGLANQGHDPIARRIVEWRYLMDKNSGASFADISAFLRANPEWPDRDILFARAEAAMGPSLDPRTVIAFFSGRDPATDIGKVRLGEAYLATGNATKGRALIQDAWMNGEFDLNQEYDIIRRDGAVLTPEVDRARLNRLLFKNEIAAAKREVARVPADAQRLAQARLALHDNPWKGMDLIKALPASLQNDSGLLFDRAKMLRQQNAVDSIPSLLSHVPMRQMAQIDPGTWWSEISADARLAIQKRSFQNAHWLVQYSGLTSGDQYADAQFLAGWLDLRFLRNPREAHTHFLNLARTATKPISKSRAYYWAGRSSEAAGDYPQAREDYRYAAQYSETFYGQLSLAKLDAAPTLHLRDTAIQTTAAQLTNYESRELTRAIHVLGDLGLVSLLRVFATYDAQTNPEPHHLKLLASDLANMGFPDVAMRVAKAANNNGVPLNADLHPLIGVPGYAGPGTAPEPAFVLAIIRQETEFDPAAVSGAGARGLMQLLVSSAKHDAGLAGMQFNSGDLLSNPTYNMRLGMVELADDLSYYGGSYLLTAAAYNAGKGNVNKWINTYGDPRSPVVDPVDWIEEIPFAETRNYVQRVLENIEVYRNRLSGRDEPLRILSDLYRPRAPDARPLPSPPARADNAAMLRAAANR